MSRFAAIAAVLTLVLGVGLFVTYGQLNTARADLQRLSVQMQFQGDNEANQEKAKEIVEQVRALMQIDESVAPTVAAILDVEKLRKQNAFYAKAENGDYLVITKTRAILFDPETKTIIDVAPVQIQQKAEQQ